MQIGAYVDGRSLTYDVASGQFEVGGTPVTLEQILQYDAFAQLNWVNPETREWAHALSGSAKINSQAPTRRRGRLLGFRSQRPWKMVVACGYYVFWALFSLSALLSRSDYALQARDVALEVLKGLALSAIMISPAVLLSDFAYRDKLPLFRRRRLAWSAAGFALVLVLFFVSFAVADALHSQQYRVAADAEIAAEKARRETAIAAELRRKEQERIAADAQAEADRLAAIKREEEEREADRAEQDRLAEEVRAKQQEVEEQTALNAVRATDEYERLISGGLSDAQARAVIQVAGTARIGFIGKVVGRDQADGDDVFLIESRDDIVNVVYGFVIKGSEVAEIRDDKLNVVYSAGKPNEGYTFWEDVGGPAAAQVRTETLITGILKAPSTAQFAGSFLDPFEGWGFEKKPGEISVSGYVDSQNSFGAMMRSQFAVTYRVSAGGDRGTLDPVYLNFDGEVVYDRR